MAITIKEALKKYDVTAKEFNDTVDAIYAKGAGKVCNTQALLAVTECIPFATKQDEEA